MKLDLNIDINSILTADYSKAWELVVEVMNDPRSNLPLALLLVGIVSLLIIIALVGAVLFISGSDDDEEEVIVDGVPVVVARTQHVAPPPEPSRLTPAQKISLDAAIGFLVLLAIWGTLGYGSSRDDVCASCHIETVHTTSAAKGPDEEVVDPHVALQCVACHESSSKVGRYGFATAERVAHMVSGLGSVRLDEYGAVTSNACLNCHERQIRETVKYESKGVLMSHKEPLDAGARCRDCHGLQNGTIPRGIGGMNRCISCHDGKQAKSACESCHYLDVSVASSGEKRTNPGDARAILQVPDCGDCHQEKETCDPCHNGVRMPHSVGFIRGGHAKEAVRDYWYGSGTACNKCHAATRRPCGKCHVGGFWSHGPAWGETHKAADPMTNACDSCHGSTIGQEPKRNFCIDLCHADKPEWRRLPEDGQIP